MKSADVAEQRALAVCTRLVRWLSREVSRLPAAGDERRFLRVSVQILAEALEACRRGLEDGADAVDADRAEAVGFPTPLFSVAEVLQFLAFNRKSGAVRIRTPGERITLELEGGDVVDAHSDNSPPGSRLGDILASGGAIAPHAVDNLAARPRRRRARIGRELVEEELVTPEELRSALHEQLLHLVKRSLVARAASIEFHPRTGYPSREEDLRLDLTGLLIESATIADQCA